MTIEAAKSCSSITTLGIDFVAHVATTHSGELKASWTPMRSSAATVLL
jgi:hypothetical protein